MDIEKYRQKKRELGLTFSDLSQKSQIPVRTLQRIFSLEENVSLKIDTIQKIERALGLSDITDEEAAAGVRDYAVRNVTPDEDDLLEDFRELGKKKGADAQKAVRDMIQAMLK